MGLQTKMTTDYSELEASDIRPPRLNEVGQIWLYDPDKNVSYLQWPDQHLNVHASGKTAWWYPYATSGTTRPILLSRYPDESEGHWLINPATMGAVV